MKDIEGNLLKVGDMVYYARKSSYSACGELVKCRITAINPNAVQLGKYRSTDPSSQIIKAKR